MLDLKLICEDLEAVKARLKRRGGDFNELDELLKPEEDRRLGLQQSELLKGEKKKLSAEVGQFKQKGQDASRLLVNEGQKDNSKGILKLCIFIKRV